MERMSGIDPMFVYSDTPETPMEIAYVCVFDPATAEGGYTFERVCGVLEARMPTLAPFRRRLVPVPLGLDHPRWVDDPEFDLGNHLQRAALPHPGGDEEFTGMVAKVMGRPLQPEQPPWEMHVIEGLAGGMVGLIAKVHHPSSTVWRARCCWRSSWTSHPRAARSPSRTRPGSRRGCRRAPGS